MLLRELLTQPQHLPTIPTSVQSLIDSFADDDVSIGKIARLISTDPGMSAKLLRLANSAYFRVARTVGTVDDAVTMLGSTMVRNLVIGSGLAGTFKTAPGLDIQQFWRYTLSTACAGRWLAGCSRQGVELGFMVGLLHGIGQFVMRTGMTQAMLDMDATVHPLDARRALLEKDRFGFGYAEVGAELARQWHFPEIIAQGISGVPEPTSPIAAVVHLAAWSARAAVFDTPPEELAARYPEAAALILGIDKSWLPESIQGTGSRCRTTDPMPDMAELTAGLEEMLGAG